MSRSTPSTPGLSQEGVKQEEPKNEQPGRIAILVLGMSQAGKSTFINWAVKSFGENSPYVPVRDGMTSKTCQVEQVFLVKKGDREVFLVDTPGPDHSEMTDEDVFKQVASWLQNSFQDGIRIHAVIYVHDISRDAITSTMRLDLDVLVRMCGTTVVEMGMVTIVTTRRGGTTIQDEEAREDILKRDLWCPHGLGPLNRVDNPGAVWRVIDAHLAQNSPPRPTLLQIQYELVYLQRDPLATWAGTRVNPTHQLKNWTYKGASDRRRQNPVPEGCREGDVVLIIMGETKGVQDLFINDLLGFKRPVVPCPGTTRLESIVILPCNDRTPGQVRTVLLHAPGMGETAVGFVEMWVDVAAWLERACQKSMIVGGMVYLEDMAKRKKGSKEESSRFFIKICGDDAKKTIVRTQWPLQAPESKHATEPESRGLSSLAVDWAPHSKQTGDDIPCERRRCDAGDIINGLVNAARKETVFGHAFFSERMQAHLKDFLKQATPVAKRWLAHVHGFAHQERAINPSEKSLERNQAESKSSNFAQEDSSPVKPDMAGKIRQ